MYARSVYRLLGRLEAGELAELCRAERDGQPVVVKLFHPRTTDLAYARVVGDVARQLRAVPHKGVSQVLEVGLVDHQRLAIVREDTGKYSLGQALTRLNTREVYLPPTVALAWVLDLLDVMQAAHDAGVLHGALTPGNVLFTAEGRAAVADFGALKALQASPQLKKTFANRGRSSYRAPELKASEPASVASDLYAVGAIAYELLTLREASTGASSVSTRAEKLPPPSRLQRRLNARIDPVIMRALEPSPSRRYRGSADFSQGLRDFLSANGGVPGAADVRKFIDELFPKDVVLDGLAAAPFTTPFELDDITSVGQLPEPAGDEPAARPPFSGGEVTDRTPTSDGLPVFREDVETVADREVPKTEPVMPAVRPKAAGDTQPASAPAAATWDAPAGAQPAVKEQPASASQADLKKRVRVQEDFAPRESEKRPAVAQAPPAPSQRQAAKTVVNFVTSFRREDIEHPPHWEELRRRAKLRARVVSFIGTAVFVTTILSLLVLWWARTPNPKMELISYLPVPVQRALVDQPIAPPPIPIPGKKVKLQSFDKLHPELALPKPDGEAPPRDPAPDKPVKKEAPKKPLEKAPERTARSGCYNPPKPAGSAYLTVASARAVRVELDGERLCGAVTKVPVAPGQHRVRVIDTKTGQEYVSPTRFEAGKIVKLMPEFRTR